MPKSIYVDRKKLKLNRKQFEEMLKKDPKAAKNMKEEKAEHDKLTKKLKEEK
jgi:hypothetical protein